MERNERMLLVTAIICIVTSLTIGLVFGYHIAIAEAYRHKAGSYTIVNSFGKVKFKWWDEMEMNDEQVVEEKGEDGITH